jgi:hypothetical protein
MIARGSIIRTANPRTTHPGVFFYGESVEGSESRSRPVTLKSGFLRKVYLTNKT